MLVVYHVNKSFEYENLNYTDFMEYLKVVFRFFKNIM